MEDKTVIKPSILAKITTKYPAAFHLKWYGLLISVNCDKLYIVGNDNASKANEDALWGWSCAAWICAAFSVVGDSPCKSSIRTELLADEVVVIDPEEEDNVDVVWAAKVEVAVNGAIGVCPGVKLEGVWLDSSDEAEFGFLFGCLLRNKTFSN